MDDNHDRILADGQLAINNKPELRLNFLNKRIEAAADSATLINLLFQRAFTYQQLGDVSSGLRDFMDADNLIAMTDFQYQVPPLDFTDLFVELQTQLYDEYMANDNVKAPKMPYLIARNDLKPFQNNSYKPGLRYPVMYGYYIQSLLFNITLIDPRIQNGKITQTSSIECANSILDVYDHILDTLDNIVYDPLTKDMILQSDLRTSLQIFTEYADPIGHERNRHLKPATSDFFKDITTIFDNALKPNQARHIDTSARVNSIQSVVSSSPLIKLLKFDALIHLDSTSVSKENLLSDERVSYSDFLFAMRLRYSPKLPASQRLYELEDMIRVQVLIRYALLSIVLCFLLSATLIYINTQKLQRKNNKLLSQIVKDVGEVEGFIVKAYLWRDDKIK